MKKTLWILAIIAVLLVPAQTTYGDSLILQKGDRKSEVVELKKYLNHLGITNFKNPTNYFGVETEAGVKTFQELYGLSPTGIVNREALEILNELYSAPLQKGRRHKDTIKLKQDLDYLGYKAFTNPTTYYGVQTERLVKEFQQKYNLPVTGIADSLTLAKIKELIEGPMFNGLRRDDVIPLKRNLQKLGFVNFKNPTNYYGVETEAGVKAFQEYFGLPVTGVADKDTVSKLEEIANTPLQKGRRHKDTIKLKQDLDYLGYKAFTNPTTYYGVQTERLVKEFQQKYNLPVTGIADSLTLAKIKELIEGPMFNGLRRDDVIPLKRNLQKLGFVNFKNPTNYYGIETEAGVKAFQEYYGLESTGIADQVTVKRLQDISNTPLQRGKRHETTIKLKQDLNLLGYSNFKNPTTLYGVETEAAVKQFQNEHGLVINGIADPVTLQKIQELVQEYEELNPTPDPGESERITYTNYNISFEQALDIQMTKSPQTDRHVGKETYVSAQYVEREKSGKAVIKSDGSNVNLRTAPQFEDNVKCSIPNGTPIEVVKEVQGAHHATSTKWYEIKYNCKDKTETLYVHSSLVDLDGSGNIGFVTASTLNVRSKPSTSGEIYGQLSKGYRVTIIQEIDGWYKIQLPGWINAARKDVQRYLDPNNNNKFQHLLLSSSVGVSASELNKILKGQGILEGLGQAFIDGAKEHKVNEIYLISHAFLETGRGTSKLATGVEVGKEKNGKLVLVTSSNRKNLKNIEETYNMFGIGAVDKNALEGGAFRAYEEGWFTPEAAVKGGAKFVGQNYIHHPTHQQNTLYKMRWNPKNPGKHQYASDIGWAVKQTQQIIKMYEQLRNPTLHFDIPVYK